MDKEAYVTMHSAADRVALESARKVTDSMAAQVYIDVYKKILEFLIVEYRKRN